MHHDNVDIDDKMLLESLNAINVPPVTRKTIEMKQTTTSIGTTSRKRRLEYLLAPAAQRKARLRIRNFVLTQISETGGAEEEEDGAVQTSSAHG